MKRRFVFYQINFSIYFQIHQAFMNLDYTLFGSPPDPIPETWEEMNPMTLVPKVFLPYRDSEVPSQMSDRYKLGDECPFVYSFWENQKDWSEPIYMPDPSLYPIPIPIHNQNILEDQNIVEEFEDWVNNRTDKGYDEEFRNPGFLDIATLNIKTEGCDIIKVCPICGQTISDLDFDGEILEEDFHVQSLLERQHSSTPIQFTKNTVINHYFNNHVEINFNP